MEKLASFLSSHPDRAFTSYILEGLTHGFRIGFDRCNPLPHSCPLNHPSALANKTNVDEKIAAELAAGRLYGPLPENLASQVHISPMGLVPKPHQLNKFHLIVDLSHPAGFSINDGIPPRLCSLQYASIDMAVNMVKQLGRGTQLVKLDIKDAYRIIPIHPADHHLLGISWRGRTYVDRALPFGLRSAPKIFSAVADVISWVLYQHGIEHHLHYLDDYLLLGAPDSKQAAEALALTFHMLGIPVAYHKTEGPATVLGFLGILMDTHLFELRLPADKLARIQEILRQWSGRRSCTRKELQSLLGHLSHAATVIIQGRTFLRQLFNLLRLDRSAHQYIRLNASARADLLWWRTFLQGWNGTSFFPNRTPSIVVTSDASGSYGCGAFSTTHGWFQLEWPDSWTAIGIAAKELVPVVIAAALWGANWNRACVCFRSDNQAVVEILTSRTSKDHLLMHLVRCLAAFFGFQFVAQHVPGVLNTVADAISRNNIPLFLSIFPQVPRVTLPQPLLDLLVIKRPDWGSSDWTKLFVSSLARDLQSPQELCTGLAGASTPGSVTSSPYPPYQSTSTPSASSQQTCRPP